MNYYYMGNGVALNEDELAHYGVVGMKWGVRKARRLSERNDRLAKKALNYDKKSASLYKKAEKQHAQKDLEAANRAATKSAKYSKKATNMEKRALTTEDDFKQAKLQRKAETLKYKAAKEKITANRLSRQTGYRGKAMTLSIKSDKVAAKAAKARMRMAKNEAYVAAMNRKVSSLPAEERQRVDAFIEKLGRG